MTTKRLAILLATVVIGFPSLAGAQGKAKLAREAAEYVLGKFGKQAVGEGVETFARKIETLAVKYGDEAVEAVR
ncbi:MAG: hypothetical protein ACKO23_07805, partial [Gemmataceae bacterium]